MHNNASMMQITEDEENARRFPSLCTNCTHQMIQEQRLSVAFYDISTPDWQWDQYKYDDRYIVVVFGLSKHYSVVDIHQGIRSAFLNPVHKILTTDPERGTKLFRAVDLLFSCEPGHPNNVRKSDPAQQKFFPWKILIIHRNANESLQELQKDVISRLTHYPLCQYSSRYHK